MKRATGCLLLSVLGVLGACGGSDNTGIGNDDAGSDAGGGIDAASDGTSSDGGGGVDGGGDADATLPDGSPCVPLASNATDVYVDKRFTGAPSTGVAACPFTTILAGIAAAAGLPGKRTVHVAGDTPALVYAESGPVPVNTNVTLLGGGPAKTTISASGTCGAGTCAVMVNGAAVLEGFTVISSLGDGIVASLTAPAPVVRDTFANGSKGNGILALGAIALGPSIHANKNGGHGLASTGTGLVHVIAAAGGGANSFDNNTANGIDVEGATLQFEGGSAVGNLNGIRFGTAGSLATTHTITALTATGNSSSGIAAFLGQNLKIRSSTLLTNAGYGLFYSYVAGYALDLGIVGGLGANKLGTATGATRNTKAGMYLCHSRGTASQPAEGDTFAACPPTQTSLAGCDVAPGSYTDVAYAPTVAGDPVVAVACTVGP